jgi:hypothetical protein
VIVIWLGFVFIGPTSSWFRFLFFLSGFLVRLSLARLTFSFLLRDFAATVRTIGAAVGIGAIVRTVRVVGGTGLVRETDDGIVFLLSGFLPAPVDIGVLLGALVVLLAGGSVPAFDSLLGVEYAFKGEDSHRQVFLNFGVVGEDPRGTGVID